MISVRRAAGGSIAAGQSRAFHHDAQSNTRLLSDAAGAVTDRYAYRSFGEELSTSGTTPNPYRFGGSVGYYSDKPQQRVYVRARHYQPPTGRWLTRDPIGFRGRDFNLYRYVGNNPVTKFHVVREFRLFATLNR